MPHRNTIFAQMLELIPRHEFGTLAKNHHVGQKLRSCSRWYQFVAMVLGQLTPCYGLRDIESQLQTHQNCLYHLGAQLIPRSSLARINEQQPYQIYEGLFYKLYEKCQQVSPKHRFRFKNKFYAFDATYLHLHEHGFPWAQYAKSKGGLKIHLGLDQGGGLPAFVHLGRGNQNDLSAVRDLSFPKSSIVVFDRGYIDHGFLERIDGEGTFFVVRLRKDNVCLNVKLNAHTKQTENLKDERVRITRKHKPKESIGPFRRITSRDPETGKTYYYLTNHLNLAANTIVQIYRERWNIEVFFKWIKQNLKIKTFFGTSPNAVYTQIWIALCVNLIIHYLRHLTQSSWNTRQIFKKLQSLLFEKREITLLLRLEVCFNLLNIESN